MADSIYKAEHPIYFHDTDMNGGIKISALMNYCAVDAGAHCEAYGYSYNFLAEKDFAYILSRIEIKLLHSSINSDRISIGTWQNSVSGPYFNRVALISAGEDPVAEYISTWVVVKPSDRSIVKPSNFPYTIPSYTEEAFGETKAVKLRNREDVEYLATVPVTFSQIDRNKHLNNTKYADVVFDALFKQQGDVRPVKRFCINYVREAVLGEDMELFASRGDTVFVKGTVKGETSFLCEIEFA